LILFSPKLGNFSSERFFQTSFPFIFPDVLVDLGLTVVISEFMKRQGNERALRECLQRLPACFHETDQVASVLLFGMLPLIENRGSNEDRVCRLNSASGIVAAFAAPVARQRWTRGRT